MSTSTTLPDSFRDVEHLEEVMTTPTAALIADLEKAPGDIIVLGVGGKMGPTLARMAKRAAPNRRVVGVARFSEKGLREDLTKHGIECIEADLLDRKQVEALPKLPNVIFMAGRKFGSTGYEDLTWAMNAYVPALVAEAFIGSRIVAFSTGNVYPWVNLAQGGATEATPAVPPPGTYANSCAARENIFQYFSRTTNTPGRIIRLNYAIDMRYGVLHDIASKILSGKAIDVSLGHVNFIWQGDASSQALRCLEFATTTSGGGADAPSSSDAAASAAAKRFVEGGGLGPLFGGFMGRSRLGRGSGDGMKKSKSIGDNSGRRACLGLVVNLLQRLDPQEEEEEVEGRNGVGAPSSAPAAAAAAAPAAAPAASPFARVLSKFREAGFEKLDRLIDLAAAASSSLAAHDARVAAREKLRAEEEGREEEAAEEDEDEEAAARKLVARLSAGGDDLQLCALAAAYCWSSLSASSPPPSSSSLTLDENESRAARAHFVRSLHARGMTLSELRRALEERRAALGGGGGGGGGGGSGSAEERRLTRLLSALGGGGGVGGGRGEDDSEQQQQRPEKRART